MLCAEIIVPAFGGNIESLVRQVVQELTFVEVKPLLEGVVARVSVKDYVLDVRWSFWHC